MAEERVIDWQAVEDLYRAGIRSLRSIAEEYGVTEGAIRKRAKRDGWERDLSTKIAEKAEALVRKEAVRSEVRTESERTIIDANAMNQASAILQQRKDAGRARGIVQKLFDEIESQIDSIGDFQRLGELLQSSDEDGVDRLNELYKKVISLPSRIDGTKKLSDALKTLIELERKVLRIKEDDIPDDAGKAITGIIRRIVDHKADGTGA